MKIMRRDVPGLPDMCLPCVDVRDVAEAHIKALITPGIHGQRIVISKDSYKFLDEIAVVLRDEFSQYGYRPQTRKIGYWPLKLASYFDSQVAYVLPMIGTRIILENSLSK